MENKEITKEEFLNAVEIVNRYTNDLNKKIGVINYDQSKDLFYDIDLSVRLTNVLINHINDDLGMSSHNFKVSDLSKTSQWNLFRCRNFGKKCMVELLEVCREYNVDLPRY